MLPHHTLSPRHVCHMRYDALLRDTTLDAVTLLFISEGIRALPSTRVLRFALDADACRLPMPSFAHNVTLCCSLFRHVSLLLLRADYEVMLLPIALMPECHLIIVITADYFDITMSSPPFSPFTTLHCHRPTYATIYRMNRAEDTYQNASTALPPATSSQEPALPVNTAGHMLQHHGIRTWSQYYHCSPSPESL